LDNRVKSYYRLNLLRAAVFNFERHELFNDSIGHPCQKLLSFEFVQSLCYQFCVSRYITVINQTPKQKVIVIWILWELLYSILSVKNYEMTQLDIRVKSYCHLNLLRASIFNFERLDILLDSIRHPSKRLLSFDFARSFCFQFRASWCMTRLNRTSE